MKAIADKNQEIETTDAFTHGKKMTKVGESKIACKGYVFISILFYITGLLHMVWLKASPILFCIVGGTILIAYGIIKVIGYFSNDLYCLAFQYDLGCGLFLAVVGVIVLVRNLHIQEYLMPGLGLLILMDSLMKVQTAKEARLFGLKPWFLLLILSILAGTFGILILVEPFQKPWAAHLITGCGLLAEGAMNHLMVKDMVKIMNVRLDSDKDLRETGEKKER